MNEISVIIDLEDFINVKKIIQIINSQTLLDYEIIILTNFKKKIINDKNIIYANNIQDTINKANKEYTIIINTDKIKLEDNAFNYMIDENKAYNLDMISVKNNHNLIKSSIKNSSYYKIAEDISLNIFKTELLKNMLKRINPEIFTYELLLLNIAENIDNYLLVKDTPLKIAVDEKYSFNSADKMLLFIENFRNNLIKMTKNQMHKEYVSRYCQRLKCINHIPPFTDYEYELLNKYIEQIRIILFKSYYFDEIEELLKDYRKIENMIDNQIKSKYKVTIILVTYNNEKSIEKTLKAIQKQTFIDYEIIVIDDNSSDDTVKVISEFDNTIKIIENNKRIGIGASRNNALKYSKGKYIYYMDTDTLLKKDDLNILYHLADKYTLDILIAQSLTYENTLNTAYIKENKDLSKNKRLLNTVFNIKQMDNEELSNIQSTMHGKLCLKSFIEKINVIYPLNKIHQDEVFYYECITQARRVMLTDKVNIHVKKNPYPTDKILLNNMLISKMYVEIFKKHRLYDNFKEEILNKTVDLNRLTYTVIDSNLKEEYYIRLKNCFNDLIKEYEIYPDCLKYLTDSNQLFLNSIITSISNEDFDKKLMRDKYE